MDAPVSLLSPWRRKILQCLRTRNEKEYQHLSSFVESHERLNSQLEDQKKSNESLLDMIDELKKEKLELQIKADSGIGPALNPNDRASVLEKKVFKLQEELTDLHRNKGQNAQTIIDLNEKVKEYEKQSQAKEAELVQTAIRANSYADEIKNLEQAILEKENANVALKDEQQTLQLLCNQLETTLRKVQEENTELITRWMQEKAKHADEVNKGNELIHGILDEKHKKEQQKEESSRRTRTTSMGSVPTSPPIVPSSLGPSPGICFGAVVPSRFQASIDAHDSEVNTVRFCPSGNMFVTAGNDRKVKVWSVSAGQFNNKGTLLGSNAGVSAIDFDVQEQFVLGASNDFAIRVWGMHDHRQRHTLTGHSGKVLAGRFLSDPNKIVSGSHDRTLKIWDLRNRSCIKTIFAGSSCNDLVTTDGAGTNIISGHFDKRIRFWDIRSDGHRSDILLQGRVTSLDLSQEDRTLLLCCTKDDTLQMIDLRMNKILMSCVADGFKVQFDWTRAALSPDAKYASAGSQDGKVYIWNVQNGEVANTLDEHEGSVIAVSWHPSGCQLLSCDRRKRVILWN